MNKNTKIIYDIININFVLFKLETKYLLQIVIHIISTCKIP